MSDRNRMTAQSKVNVKAATMGILRPADGGYTVTLEGQTGKQVDVLDGDGDPIVYPSMAEARKAMHRHKPGLPVDLEPEI